MKKKKNEHWEVEIDVLADGIRWLRLPLNYKSENKAAVVRKYHELIERVKSEDFPHIEMTEHHVNEKPDYMATIEYTRFKVAGGYEKRNDFGYDLRINLLYYPFNLKYEF